MKSPDSPSQNNGPTLVLPEKQSSPEFQLPKRNSRRRQETPADPLTNGSPSSIPRKTLGRENGNGLNSTAGQDNQNLLPVPKRLPKPVDRAAQALKRLGVDVVALRSAPEITSTLKNAEGGMKAVLGAMRFNSQDPSVAAFLEKYDSIPSGDRDKLSWEAVGLAAGVNLQQLGWAAITALEQHCAGITKVLLVSSQPKIMRARIKYGLLPSGEKDRTAAQTASGVLPSPKGPTFIGKAVFGSGKNTMNAQGVGTSDDGDDEDGTVIDATDDDANFESIFPDSRDTQKKLIPIRQRMLEDGK